MSNCDHCRWFVRKNPTDTAGLCRRRAPLPLEVAYNSPPRVHQWPTVQMSDFCGDHETAIPDDGGEA